MEALRTDALECAQRCWQAARSIDCDEETRAALDRAAWKYLMRDVRDWERTPDYGFGHPLPRALSAAGGRPAREL
jgi:hypothetical protein